MPQEILKQRIMGLTSVSVRDQQQLIFMFNNIIDGIRAITAKLDADATVTDTNYTAVFDALVTK